jgi:hypothetical protein
LVVACGGILFSSVIFAYSEVSPYFMAGFSSERRFVSIGSGQYVMGGSLWSKDLVFRDCLADSSSLFSKTQPGLQRLNFLTACLSQARKATDEMPQYARGWLVAAAIDIELQHPEAFLADLAMATRTAPSVHWLAERRSELAERHFAILDAEALANLDADTLVMMQSDPGRLALAKRYFQRPASRDRLQSVIGAAPPAAQADFVAKFKQIAQQTR